MEVSRRGFLAAGAGGVGVTSLSMLSSCAEQRDAAPQELPLRSASIAFDGAHQAGVQQPAQASLNLIGFRLNQGVDAKAIVRLMRLWTEDARRLTAGQNPLGSLEPELTTWPANLTITCGFGPRIFQVAAPHVAPAWLHDIPALSRDQLDPQWGQTDLVLQICCDDPVMGAWAMRHMTRAGVDYVRTAWVQQGFVNAHGATPEGETPRNLFGQVDGTVNPRTDEDFAQQVWINEGPLAGGTSLVVRRIAMHLDTWELLDRRSREEVVGRTLATGAPLTGGDEFTEPDLQARDAYGLPVIDPNSHMARARATGAKILRRPYNYSLPPEPGATELSNVGLIFMAYQQDPDASFTPLLTHLNEADRLNEWITHIGSAVYFIPRGTAAGEYWGQGLLQG